MALLGLFGALGTGKTLALTAFGFKAQQKANAHILANYTTTYADITKSAEEILLMLTDLVVDDRPNICLFDELGNLVKSVDFMRSDNELLTKIFLESRKKGTDIYYTSQHAMMVDRNIRRITDVVMFPFFNEDKEIVELQRIENFSTSWIAKPELIRIDAPKYYNMYDTNEIIETDRFAVIDYLYDMIISNDRLMKRLNKTTSKKERIELMTFITGISHKVARIINNMLIND